MDKIVDVILDSVSTALGERVKEQVQKQKLNKLSILKLFLHSKILLQSTKMKSILRN